ncbi:MAG: DEAD/DEAH box helicase, partial [Candidatus Dormibacteraeota bacterium]|nr:DEAD/DEAH box helicase [Candidatus Dormibacteraeota bacterium]
MTTLTTDARDLLEAFEKTLPFSLDDFQREAIEKMNSHDGVLVAAPTSSGKTVVADYAIFEALQAGVKAIYTTPLKALSNQKFRDLKRKYGEGYVGLVTGEHTINEQAPAVVMTTEILRNLIYEDPRRLDDVRYVILDEVHYIDDYPRGAVWEEIMIQAPEHIRFVGLSATISNYQQVVDWMATHRGRMATVVVIERPVELRLWLAMHNQLRAMFDNGRRVLRDTWNRAQEEDATHRHFPRHRNLSSNDMLHVIQELQRQEMVPAIYFIFSRRGCEEALQRCAVHGLDLTTSEEKDRIAAIVAEKMGELVAPDEKALYQSLLNQELLAQGIAVHHAGLLPFLKELVEELFATGLIKVVFATETLALGIHMPARAVVISTFTKFDGRAFPTLSSGLLTQLMGRAGRRGIDKVGHGVILKDPEVDVGVIYEAAMGEDMVVESKFAPTYNMALNLLRHRTLEEAELLMQRSFGQFQRREGAEHRREELANLEERLHDVERMMFPAGQRDKCKPEDVIAYFRDEAALRTLRNRLRRAKRVHWRGTRGTRHQDEEVLSEDQFQQLRREMGEIRDRHERSAVRRCPNLRAHRAQTQEIFTLREEIRRVRDEIEGAIEEYAHRLRALINILEESGFLVGLRPSEKGMLASRVYGENGLLITEAIHEGWLDDLEPAELCAVVVMLAAEDRGGPRRGRGPDNVVGDHKRHRFPTPAVGDLFRALRSLHHRFSVLEEAYGEHTLR